VTAWGSVYEIFPETGPLVAGETAVAHTHVTVLDGFSPLTEGTVEVILRSDRSHRSENETFRADTPDRPGIFPVEIRPETPGTYDLSFRIDSEAGTEEIRAGRVRVGTEEDPGGITVAPAPRGATAAGEPIPFLKEEQWRSDFATTWVRRSTLRDSVEGLARVRPPAGGEVRITAPVDGVLRGTPWPWPGRSVQAGATLFRLVPRTGTDRSLPALEADVSTLERELATARERLVRLEELLKLEAVPRREVEELATRVDTMDTRLAAATRDLEVGRAVRAGGTGLDATDLVTLAAPFTGEVATVLASPGAAVAAGEPLARLVRSDAVWLNVALAPADARRLAGPQSPEAVSPGVTGVVLESDDGSATEIGGERVRLVSVAPEIDRATGTVAALIEVDLEVDLEVDPGTGSGDSAPPSLPALGSTVPAHLLLADEREGIVVPSSALVDDGGVTVVYLQLAGERFARQPVHVLERRGDRVLVDGLQPGQRLVTGGGHAIRRSSLMATGQAHGHVH
jgi:multidrug efflux pump subunit AcrA (membrane-fusion protein)